jgi:hypothetical protein
VSLAARIARLERRPGLRPRPAPCPDCGLYPHGQGPPPEFRMEFARDGPPRSQWCGRCGTQLVYAMEFDRAG